MCKRRGPQPAVSGSNVAIFGKATIIAMRTIWGDARTAGRRRRWCEARRRTQCRICRKANHAGPRASADGTPAKSRPVAQAEDDALMISDIDLRRADEFPDPRNLGGRRVWMRIVRAIEELQRQRRVICHAFPCGGPPNAWSSAICRSISSSSSPSTDSIS